MMSDPCRSPRLIVLQNLLEVIGVDSIDALFAECAGGATSRQAGLYLPKL